MNIRFIIAKLSEGLFGVPMYQRVILSSMRIIRVLCVLSTLVALIKCVFSRYRDMDEAKVRLIQLGKYFLWEVFAHFSRLIIEGMREYDVIDIEQPTMTIIVFIIELIALIFTLKTTIKIALIKKNKVAERKSREQEIIRKSLFTEKED